MAAPGGAGLTWRWLLCLPLCLLGGLQSAQVLAGGASSPPVCLAKPAHSLDTFLVGVLQEFPALDGALLPLLPLPACWLILIISLSPCSLGRLYS